MLTTTLVASWLQAAGISQSRCSNSTSPAAGGVGSAKGFAEYYRANFQRPLAYHMASAAACISASSAATMARAAAKLVGLAEAAGRMPADLSGGMQKRAAIARAIRVYSDALRTKRRQRAEEELVTVPGRALERLLEPHRVHRLHAGF